MVAIVHGQKSIASLWCYDLHVPRSLLILKKSRFVGIATVVGTVVIVDVEDK
jgi:hypothetical protein